MPEVDYECDVEIVTEKRSDLYLLVVVRFPNSIIKNCQLNPDAITINKQDQCFRLCDQVQLDPPRSVSTYFTASLMGNMRFRFVSNCSINSEMNVSTLCTLIVRSSYYRLSLRPWPSLKESVGSVRGFFLFFVGIPGIQKK